LPANFFDIDIDNLSGSQPFFKKLTYPAFIKQSNSQPTLEWTIKLGFMQDVESGP
jgi:hypothetical protein